MYSDLKYLSVPLPEDLQKLKGFGDFERMERVIHMKLENQNLPAALRERLKLELEIIKLLPKEYPYDTKQAMERLSACFGAFTEEELDFLRDSDAVEWAYINGVVKYKDNFLSNLIKTRKAYAARVQNEKRLKYANFNDQLLDGTIAAMKAQGGMNMRFHVRSTMRFTLKSENAGKHVRAYIPIPIEYAQVKNFKILSVVPNQAVIAPSDYPQRTAIYQGCPKENEAFSVEYTYETHMNYVKPEPDKAASCQPSFYTEEYAPHIRFTPYLRWLAKEIVGDEENPLVKARRIYDFITTKVIYSYMRAYMTMTMIPEYIATSLKGDCGVQALLFITLCRIAGVPARWQAGLYMEPMEVGSHDWAQFYVAPYGWLFADPSFGGSAFRKGNEEHRDFYFGNLDPYRMPANSAFQHDFYIESKHLRHDPYDNQQGEAEYEDAPLSRDEYEVEHEMISYEEI